MMRPFVYPEVRGHGFTLYGCCGAVHEILPRVGVRGAAGGGIDGCRLYDSGVLASHLTPASPARLPVVH